MLKGKIGNLDKFQKFEVMQNKEQHIYPSTQRFSYITTSPELKREIEYVVITNISKKKVVLVSDGFSQPFHEVACTARKLTRK